jgi:hypothetical protein
LDLRRGVFIKEEAGIFIADSRLIVEKFVADESVDGRIEAWRKLTARS